MRRSVKIALTHMRHAHAGGTERHLNQLATHLAAAGHDVTILCRSHEAAPHPAVRMRQLRSFAVGATWRVRAFAKDVERHVRTEHYDLVYGLGRTWTQDVLRLGGGSHATYLELAHEATRVGFKRLRAPFERKHSAWLEIERRAFSDPRLARVVVNARMVQQDIMCRYGLPADRFELIYNGVDTQRFTPARRAAGGAALRRDCGIPAEALVALFLGSGYGRKGLDGVLRAFAASRHRSAHLIVVGYDSAQSSFQSLAATLGVAARTHFLGGRRDAEDCFAAGDLYLLPTRYDPFANTTLEALATGLPVLTTLTNGAHELLSSGVEGEVLPQPEDVSAWTLALDSWLDPARLAIASPAARRLALGHTVESKMRQSMELLERVLEHKRFGAPGA